MSENKHVCLQCGQSSDQIPLLSLEYRGDTHWICPQHLPLLIHKPWLLADKLPGAENLSAHESD